jgi:hypothetical protein
MSPDDDFRFLDDLYAVRSTLVPERFISRRPILGQPGRNLRTVRRARLNALHSALNRKYPTATATSYQRSAIHCAPTTISQTPIVATVITIAAASREIESRTPSSSR